MIRIISLVVLVVGCAVAVCAQDLAGKTFLEGAIDAAENFFVDSEVKSLSPTARISFYGTAAGDLCVVVAGKRGPGGILKSYFSFRRSMTTDQGTRAEKLKIKFAKGTESSTGRFWAWDQCLVGQARNPSSDQDVLEVTISRPGQDPTSFSIVNPLLGYIRTADIREDGYGHVTWRKSVEKIAAE